jgi:hypothetical protein
MSMAEVGKSLDYIEVRTTERWINTQGESACQALKRKGRQGLYKVCQRKRDEVCHGSAGTPLRTHAGGETLGLQDAHTAIRM